MTCNFTSPDRLYRRGAAERRTNPRTKTFSYDAYGHRIAMSDKPAGSTDQADHYTYATDVHGSISQLIDTAGNVKASYGYTPYGSADAPATDNETLTTGDTNNQAPLNPYRYTGKRLDSGTTPSQTPAGPAGAAGYDMGARRYGPDITSFLQQDQFHGALANLGLALDPLTQNRYALAGGNPISYIETDGHIALIDGGGGGSYTPSPSTDDGSGDDGGNWFTDRLGDLKEGLDRLDANTVENPDWALYDVYQGWTKFEETAEPIVGATDVYECATEQEGGSCAWAGAALIPGAGLGKGALKAGVSALRSKATYAYYRTAVEFLDVSSRSGGAVFYSGGPGYRKAAEEFATRTGRTTLEMTPGGRWLDKKNLWSTLPSDKATNVWKVLSQRYAQQASGDVTAITRGHYSRAIFWNTELPALQKNPLVTGISILSRALK